ncbi:2-oxoglutarate dehydrogenase E1 component [Candidatus Anaplasma sp. TIGMIC]|uniref:2-oxoglutarate dehydrogenase E1 component n=1 Tax=Candidatus Anaplasma sp. TIGMIC TaxID=3020713 RepID=UPI0039775F76
MYGEHEQGSAELPEGWGQLFSRIKERAEDASVAEKKHPKSHGDDADELYRVLGLMNFFRSYGHASADLDPLKMAERTNIDYERYLTLIDPRGDSALWPKAGFSVDKLLQKLMDTYCRNIGFEYMHIHSDERRMWLQDRIESARNKISADEKKEILNHLHETEMFEQFLHVRYPGYKRFSVEGGDTLIVALEKAIALAPSMDIAEIVIGMPHRGRLNVLTKITKKPYVAMLHEFSGGTAYRSDLNVTGDVKYHLGYSHDRNVMGKNVHITLTANPSHLEAVNPVVMGRVRAKMDRLGVPVLGIMVHGDASFIGQGVVAEGFNIGGVDGYAACGYIHIVVNNQVGFTTNPSSARTSLYCSDVAKMVDAPVFHVNGDDPESVVEVMQIAMEYRDKFKKDVVVDIVCYRRHGHNEGDAPSFTQPLMYGRIAKHKTVATSYGDKLVAEGVVSKEEIESFRKQFRAGLDSAYSEVASYKPPEACWYDGYWKGLKYPTPGKFDDYLTETGVDGDKLVSLMRALCSVPAGITIDKKLSAMLNARLESMSSGCIDWGAGETLAFASLLAEKKRVRLSGQDCGRGTFSHRHAMLIDQVTGAPYVPLNNLGVDQEKFEVLNSPLSEYAVMGFEYGYSLDSPDALVMWEAQFGDFANGAQIIVDQFIVSAETKWLRSSGLVLLLPHGYEGQGPEHSSARIERYLQLCASDNIQVVNCTTPANYFHVLRRQLHRDFRKPLVVFTPKSLLRHKLAVSKLSDFSGRFMPVIGEAIDRCTGAAVKKVVICSGKVYYDLLAARGDRADIALLRLEQFYPFPKDILAAELAKYPAASVVWCQEEHENMGGWQFVRHRIEESMQAAKLKGAVTYVGRPESASTAVGYASMHAKEQELILSAILS